MCIRDREEMARAKHYQDSIQAIAQKEAERLAQAATAQRQNATLHLDSTSMFRTLVCAIEHRGRV